ncbi:MAG TPA: helix-turn-helix transcriptional regulator [Ktedonobacteraceae bacterium]
MGEIQERNRVIGRILRGARSQKRISVTTCAELLGTSRRRYAAMERGEAIIGAAELETLVRFLEVPVHAVWSDLLPNRGAHQVMVKALPGETVQIIVDLNDK